MDKKSLLVKILGRKQIADYSYAILFFLISSFFLIFAIKPALSIAFSLERESGDLKRVNDIYEHNILKLVDIQSNLERIRDRLDLLESAVPLKPDTQKMILDIRKAATDQNIEIRNFEMSNVDLKKSTSGKKARTITISLQLDADYPSTTAFINEILSEKRLKTIKRLLIAKDTKSATDSSKLRVTIEVEGHYL